MASASCASKDGVLSSSWGFLEFQNREVEEGRSTLYVQHTGAPSVCCAVMTGEL